MITVEQCEAAIGIPAKEWPGRCYEIACAILDAGLVEGRPVYGHWLGRVDRNAPVFGERAGQAFQRHGWIETEDGEVIDPTRWVFENARPYIFEGSEPIDFTVECKTCGHIADEHESGSFFNECKVCDCEDFDPERWPYDEGGNHIRGLMTRPPPEYLDTNPIEFKAPQHIMWKCQALLGRKGWSFNQMLWLGGLPYQEFGPDVHAVYAAIIESGCAAAIPVDNKRKAEHQFGPLPNPEDYPIPTRDWSK